MIDLYSFVNGPWLRTHVIPEDRGVDGTFHQLRDRAEADTHAIIEVAEGLAGTLYRSFMDTEQVNAAGMKPLVEDLALLEVDTIPAYLEALGALERTGVGTPLSCYVAKAHDSEESIVYLAQSGLGLPDEAYYREQAHAETLAAYREHVAAMLGFLDARYLLGRTPGEAAELIVNLEKEIAAGHWNVVDSRDALKTNNPTEFAALPELLQTMLRASGLPAHTLVAMMPSYNEHLAQLLIDVPLDTWRLHATWQLLRARAEYLPEEVGRKNFEFYGTRLSGATTQRDRWKRAVALAEALVGHDVGREFVKKHFPPSSKEEMLTLVDYLTAAYRERISALPWMTETTKEKALAKLEKFRAKIGYPDTWRDYSGLEFSPNGADLMSNIRAGSTFIHEYELAKVGKPVDRDEWFANPQTVNAFYNPTVNDITFPAAILRAPFYSPEMEAAEQFGAIGAVIGHEIGHGFDDQGSQYDGDGNLQSWWSEEDRAAFTKLTDQLVEQFQGLVPSVLKEAGIESAGVNGQFTLGENIGDLGGLGIAVIAYRRFLQDHNLTFSTSPTQAFEVEGAAPELYQREFNGLQRLFLSWARVWRTAIRPELSQQYLAIDPHSPAEFRCNVIAANIPEFYEAFPEVTTDSPMFIAPERRVQIW